jgi:hypothetical protein
MNRRPHLLSRIGRRLADENGMAMIIAFGVMLVLGVSTSSALVYSTQNQGSAARSKVDAAALSLAEAGINNAMSVLSNPTNDATSATLLSSRTDTYDNGTVTWSGAYDTATATWTLTAVGEMRNPTGVDAMPVRRRVTTKVPVTTGSSPTSTLQNPLWNFDVSTRTGNTCDQTLNTAVIAGAPLFIMGNLCLNAQATVTTGPLEVRGSLTTAADATIGLLGTPIVRADVAGGCNGHTCSATDRVYASTLTQTVPALTPPTADWDYWYENASPGPKHPCEQASGPYPTLDNNTARDRSLPTLFSLTPPTSYTCRTGPNGNPTGELSWNAATKVLTITGTVFIDGQARIDNGQIDTYRGQGVLYTSGSFSVANGSKMCVVVALGDCDFTPSAWNPNQNFFAVVSNGSGGTGVFPGNGVQLGCLDRFQGALFATNSVEFTLGAVGAKRQGPIIAAKVAFAAAAELKPFTTLTSVPRGLPGQAAGGARVGSPTDFTG